MIQARKIQSNTNVVQVLFLNLDGGNAQIVLLDIIARYLPLFRHNICVLQGHILTLDGHHVSRNFLKVD